MIDWTRVVGFDWDAGNERKSADKHGVSRAEAEQAFFSEPLLVLRDERHSAYRDLGSDPPGIDSDHHAGLLDEKELKVGQR